MYAKDFKDALSALSIMSDFWSTFLQEYSWLQRSYCILIVKAVINPLESSQIQRGIKTKQPTHTPYRWQTADICLSDEDRETRYSLI